MILRNIWIITLSLTFSYLSSEIITDISMIIAALFSIVFLNDLTCMIKDVDRSSDSTWIDSVCIEARSSSDAYFFSFDIETDCLSSLIESSISLTSYSLLPAFKFSYWQFFCSISSVRRMSATSLIFFHWSTSSVDTIINERLNSSLVRSCLCMSTSHLTRYHSSSLMFFASLSQWEHARNIELFSWIVLLTERCLDHVSSKRYESFWTSDCALIRSMQTILLLFNNKSIAERYYRWLN